MKLLEMSQMLVKMMPTWQTMIIPNNIPNEQFMVKIKEIQKEIEFYLQSHKSIVKECFIEMSHV